MTERSSGVRVGSWNTEWADPESVRARRIRPILAAPKCHVLCVTEGYKELLPSGGHVIDGGEDWGYPIVPGRREVLLWSKWPWRNKWPRRNSSTVPGSMAGRFVAGVTETPIGELTVCGVCIPWFHAHVLDGRKDRKMWEEHLDWLRRFGGLSYATGSRTIVLGDFNQRIPRTTFEPHKVRAERVRASKRRRVAVRQPDAVYCC